MFKMTKNLNKELKKYYRDIGKALSGSKEKKAIITQIKSSVNNYLEENQNATISDVVNRIGSPQQIADEYIDNQSNDEIAAKIKVGKRILIIAISSVVLALVIYIAFVIASFVYDMRTTDTYSETVISEISQSDTI